MSSDDLSFSLGENWELAGGGRTGKNGGAGAGDGAVSRNDPGQIGDESGEGVLFLYIRQKKPGLEVRNRDLLGKGAHGNLKRWGGISESGTREGGGKKMNGVRDSPRRDLEFLTMRRSRRVQGWLRESGCASWRRSFLGGHLG